MLTVGASFSLSGRFAPQGRQAYQGLTLWSEGVNRAGGLVVEPGAPPRLVRVLVYDDASHRDGAAAHTERLIAEDRVDLLLGPYSSVLALAAGEVAARHGRTLWNHGGSSDAMVERRWRHVATLLSPASSYFVPLLDLAVHHAGRSIRRVMLVHGARGTFPAAVIAGAEAHAHRLGLEVVASAAYPDVSGANRVAPSPSHSLPRAVRGRGEHEPLSPPLLCAGDGVGGRGPLQILVRDIAGIGPDVILGAGTTEADIAFAQEIRMQRLRPELIGLVAAGVQQFQDTLGVDAEGFCGPSQWEPTLRDQPDIGPTSAGFAAAFRARFGMAPDYPAAQAYAAGLIAAHCVQLAGSLDDLAIRQVAASLDTTTFYGRFRLDPLTGHQMGHQIVVVQWQAGQKQVIWPLTAATAALL